MPHVSMHAWNMSITLLCGHGHTCYASHAAVDMLHHAAINVLYSLAAVLFSCVEYATYERYIVGVEVATPIHV